MSVYVLIGYKDEDDEYYGFLGSLEAEEYTILNRLSERCTSSGILSTDELKALSDVKDLLAKTQIKLYDVEKELTEEVNQKLENVRNSLGTALESFDIYREEAPQLDLLLSFCIIDAGYSEIGESGEYESENFEYVNTADEEVILFKEGIESGAVKHIALSEELLEVIGDWSEFDKRRVINEAQTSELDENAMETEIEWWRDNMAYFEDITSFNLTTILFRAIRNNVLKCKRTGDSVLSSVDWQKKIELL